MPKKGGRVRIKGDAELMRKLRRLPEAVERVARKAVKDETHDAAEDLRRDAPVLTGDLKESIQEESLKKGMTGRAAITDPAVQEIVHGTSDTPAHDFVTSNIERVRKRFPQRVKDEVRAELRRL